MLQNPQFQPSLIGFDGRPFQINSALTVVEVDGGDGVHHDGEQDTNWQSPHF